MPNNEKKERKIYIRSTKQWVPVTKKSTANTTAQFGAYKKKRKRTVNAYVPSQNSGSATATVPPANIMQLETLYRSTPRLKMVMVMSSAL